MKIAAVSEDGVTISVHFGRAPLYVVLTIEDGKIIAREQRDKMGHAQFTDEPHDEAYGAGPRGHGFDPAAQSRHARMITAIADCQILLTRGMGVGAYESVKRAGIRPIITDVADIETAALAAARGELIDHVERLH